ncbi:hypothetical protein C1646_759922 [Rhizophagus diaphanus]|nr:hypothetical protein C1646_759922 [Rhizophagus diaphanus] [Rhizophagus sp. MUCL 43196]
MSNNVVVHEASVNAANGLWEIIATNFDHNHEINNNAPATTAISNENDNDGTSIENSM